MNFNIPILAIIQIQIVFTLKLTDTQMWTLLTYQKVNLKYY